MKNLSIIVAILIVGFFSSAAHSQSVNTQDGPPPKTGENKKESAVVANWKVVLDPTGQKLDGDLKIEKTSGGYIGSVSTSLGSIMFSKIKIEGDTFTSPITFETSGQTINGTISGKASENKIEGNILLDALPAISYAGRKP